MPSLDSRAPTWWNQCPGSGSRPSTRTPTTDHTMASSRTASWNRNATSPNRSIKTPASARSCERMAWPATCRVQVSRRPFASISTRIGPRPAGGSRVTQPHNRANIPSPRMSSTSPEYHVPPCCRCSRRIGDGRRSKSAAPSRWRNRLPPAPSPLMRPRTTPGWRCARSGRCCRGWRDGARRSAPGR